MKRIANLLFEARHLKSTPRTGKKIAQSIMQTEFDEWWLTNFEPPAPKKADGDIDG